MTKGNIKRFQRSFNGFKYFKNAFSNLKFIFSNLKFISAICLVTSILSLSEEPRKQPFWIENSQFPNDESDDSDNSDDSDGDDGADPLGPHAVIS